MVAAVIETHGRKKTADLIEGIELVPPKYIEYRDKRFPELDVEIWEALPAAPPA